MPSQQRSLNHTEVNPNPNICKLLFLNWAMFFPNMSKCFFLPNHYHYHQYHYNVYGQTILICLPPIELNATSEQHASQHEWSDSSGKTKYFLHCVAGLSSTDCAYLLGARGRPSASFSNGSRWSGLGILLEYLPLENLQYCPTGRRPKG